MSIGETLAAARESSGLSLQQVSEATRIRSSVIAGMERDDFSGAGGTVYARGHLRAIAKVVGADGDALVAQFDADHAEEGVPSATEVFESETRARRERRAGPNWSAAMAAALVAAMAILAYQVVTHAGRGSTPGPQAQPTTSLTTPGQTSSPPPASPSATPTGSPSPSATTLAQLPGNVVTLRLSIIGTASWVQVTNAAGTVLYTGTMTSGQNQDFKDKKSLSVVLGNAAAVNLVVNGQDLGVAGGDGEVYRQTFRPGDSSGSAG